jgi:hypothetical protein
MERYVAGQEARLQQVSSLALIPVPAAVRASGSESASPPGRVRPMARSDFRRDYLASDSESGLGRAFERTVNGNVEDTPVNGVLT